MKTFLDLLLAPIRGLVFIFFLPIAGFALCGAALIDLMYTSFCSALRTLFSWYDKIGRS